MNLRDALELHRNGRLDEADYACRELLEQNPCDAQAHHLLGVLLHQQGRQVAARQHLERACELAPAVAEFHLSHGLLLGALGNHEE
ncbi:MAG TPA: tetratricopeptide repeat protein, partial [Beijerinckiaceae bacterium]|nr:tetratricopeptide repeat protein [Beijerinckiaceae bacterium]